MYIIKWIFYWFVTGLLGFLPYITNQELVNHILGISAYGEHFEDAWWYMALVYFGIHFLVLLVASMILFLNLPLKKEAPIFIFTCIIGYLVPELIGKWWTFYHYIWAATLFYLLIRWVELKKQLKILNNLS